MPIRITNDDRDSNNSEQRIYEQTSVIDNSDYDDLDSQSNDNQNQGEE